MASAAGSDMPSHEVKQGEHVVRIAAEHGFRKFETIWDDPNNAALKQKRENPNVLFPGDVVFVPEKETREESAETAKLHRFKLRGEQLMLRLRVLDFDNEPLTNTPCELQVDGQVQQFETDDDGRIEQAIPRTAEEALLLFKSPLVPFDTATRIKIGHLDPIDEASGQAARLSNLGYFFSRDDGRDEERLDHAIQEFQCDHELEVNGVCGPETQAKLKEIHGC
jgi:N-acetylmuramoyl-L-alanine amidase